MQIKTSMIAMMKTRRNVGRSLQPTWRPGTLLSTFVRMSWLSVRNSKLNWIRILTWVTWGWGINDASGEQSQYLRQVYLTVNTSITDCGCTADYYIQTNVGPRGEDPCSGDSGDTGDLPIWVFTCYISSLFYSGRGASDCQANRWDTDCCWHSQEGMQK